jgi:transposase-like protein
MQTVVSSSTRKSATEVSATAKRRRFTAEYKRKILKEAETSKETGELGALLRREGLYSSHLATWREQAAAGQLAALAPKKRGPQAKPVDARDRELVEKDREISKWKRRAERAEALVELQKKVSQLLGIALPKPEDLT